MGPARLSAAGAVAAPGGDRDRRAARRRGAARSRRRCSHCRASARTRLVRSPRSRSAVRHPVVDTNTRRVLARAVAGRPTPVRRRRPATSRRWRNCCPIGSAVGPHLQRGDDGARRDGVHRARPACDDVPDRRGVRVARARATRRTTGRARPCRRGSRAPTARCAGSSCASCVPRTGRSPGSSSTPVWAGCRPARAARSAGSSPTDWWSATTGYRLPSGLRILQPSAGRTPRSRDVDVRICRDVRDVAAAGAGPNPDDLLVLLAVARAGRYTAAATSSA